MYVQQYQRTVAIKSSHSHIFLLQNVNIGIGKAEGSLVSFFKLQNMVIYYWQRAKTLSNIN